MTIVSGSVRKNMLTLVADSARSAELVRNGLCANGAAFITVPPYGNKMLPKQEDKNLTIRKEPDTGFTYEEIGNLLHKIEMIGRLSEPAHRAMLKEAREQLNNQLTFFYPAVSLPKIELNFFYNWVSLSLFPRATEALYKEIEKAFSTESLRGTVKVFRNAVGLVTFHNYAMCGIYMTNAMFLAVAEALSQHDLLHKDEVKAFAQRATQFGVKSVTFMEARQLLKNAPETAPIQYDAGMYNSNDFRAPLVHILSTLSKNGNFKELNTTQLKMLQTLADAPKSIDRYDLPTAVKNALRGISINFKTEIEAALADPGSKIRGTPIV